MNINTWNPLCSSVLHIALCTVPALHTVLTTLVGWVYEGHHGNCPAVEESLSLQSLSCTVNTCHIMSLPSYAYMFLCQMFSFNTVPISLILKCSLQDLLNRAGALLQRVDEIERQPSHVVAPPGVHVICRNMS